MYVTPIFWKVCINKINTKKGWWMKLANLSSSQIKSIVSTYINDRVSARKLAEKYKVSISKILSVLRRNEVEIRKSVLTNDEKNEIVKKYQSGISSYRLAKEYPVSKQAILYILRKNKVEMRDSGYPRKVPIKDIPIIIERYNNGENCTDIAKTYNCHKSQITKILHQNAVKIRQFIPMSHEWVRMKSRKYTLDQNYFSNINESKKAYWTGFIAADAYIGKNILSIRLQRQDKSHLEKFLEDIKGSYEINDTSVSVDFGKGKRKFKQTEISVFSCRLCKSLRNLLSLDTFAKSNILRFPLDLPEEFYKDFIRGILDGDGSIQYYNPSNCKVAFYGTENICEGIKKYLIKYCGVSNQEVKPKEGLLYEIKWSGRKQVIRILDWLYKDADVYLDRKYKQYLDIPKGEFKDIVDITERVTVKEIRERRECLGLSRRQVANIVGCSISYINAIENGYRTRINRDFAEVLFNILKI